MRDPTAPLSPEELLAAARAEGLELTREKLHRWRKAGLMPTPELRSLGRGRGRAARYQSGALAQALTIGALLTRSRDLDAARWLLFLDGFPVSMRHLRKQLAAVISPQVRLAEDARAASDTDDDDVAQRYLDSLARAAEKRSPRNRLVRQLVGPANMPTLLGLVRQLGTGTYSDASPEERALVSRFLPMWDSGGPTASELSWFSEFIDSAPLAAVLHQTDDETLRRARSEFLRAIAIFRDVASAVPGLSAALSLEMRRDPAWPRPLLFLYWLRHRENPQVRQAFEELAAAAVNLSLSTPHAESSAG